jgi:hypothetical protein
MPDYLLSSFNHYSKRLQERFEEQITYEEYLNKCVFKLTTPSKKIKRKQKGLRYQFGDRVKVYISDGKFEYPITIYRLDRINKSRIYKIFE